ncbi:hypothetical protein [Streptomyces vinaceus]|uniref:hypothetical protein n=1 Tax=Streptomyces vinaceus TaxID=1960 RepID=UPI00380E7E8E
MTDAATGATTSLTTQQTAHAATIAAVGASRGLSHRAVTIALATAFQESSMRNLTYGDRDSLGLFQQRPSYGWGSPEQVMDPVHASNRFYQGLARVTRYEELPLTVAAQRVQRSAYPDAYAKHEPRAHLLASALTGQDGVALRCSVSAAERYGDTGTVRQELIRAFGSDRVSGTEPADVTSAVATDTGIAVPVADGGPAAGDRARAVARWAVAHADSLKIQRVAFDGQVWEAGERKGDWGKDASARSDAVLLSTARV